MSHTDDKQASDALEHESELNQIGSAFVMTSNQSVDDKRILQPSPSRGIQRHDMDGRPIIDAMAGRASVFGFGFEPIVHAIQTAAEGYLGDASSLNPQDSARDSLVESLLELIDTSANLDADSFLLLPSADEAIDRAIGLARRNGHQNAFRTIAFVDSDHGRTGMCRSASGCPELSAGFGPMMAGFLHVPVGDLDAIRAVMDEQTAAVLVSPLDLGDAARPLEPDFLIGLRELCDASNVLLILDETRIAFGASGKPFSFSAIADIKADMLIVSAGLFGGLPGGLIIATAAATDGSLVDTSQYPIQSAVVAATVQAMIDDNLPVSTVDTMQTFAIELAETIGGYEFIRDIHALGMTFGIQADIDATVLVAAANRQGLRIEASGPTAFRIQLPLNVSKGDRQQLLKRIKQTMELVERETANLGV